MSGRTQTQASKGFMSGRLSSILIISFVVSFFVIQTLLLPSSPLQCRVSPQLLQKLKGDASPFRAQNSATITSHAANTVPVGSRLRLGYFHLLPESVAEYFGLTIPNANQGDEDVNISTSRIEMQSSSRIQRTQSNKLCGDRDDTTCAKSKDTDILVEDYHNVVYDALYQDVVDLMEEFRDFITTASMGAVVCAATTASEWTHHLSSGLSHEHFLQNGLRGIYPKGDFKALDSKYGSCGTLATYIDRNMDMARTILTYIVLCLVVCLSYFSTVSRLSSSSSFDGESQDNQNVDDNGEIVLPIHNTSLASKSQNTSPVSSPTKKPNSLESSASIISPLSVKSLIGDGDGDSHGDKLKRVGKSARDVYADVEGNLVSQDFGEDKNLDVTSTPRFKSPTRTPKARSRIARRRRELLAAVGSLLSQHKRMKSLANWTPRSKYQQIDRGTLSESFIERVHGMTTPARARLEARVEQHYHEEGDETRQDLNSSMSQEDIESQYYSELLSGIDMDDEPPIRLIDDSSALHKANESLVVESSEMKELTCGNEPDSVKVDDFAFGVLPHVSESPQLDESINRSRPLTVNNSPSSQVVMDLNISAFDELGHNVSSDSLLSDTQQNVEEEEEEEEEEELKHGGIQQQEDTPQLNTDKNTNEEVVIHEEESDIRKLKVEFETIDLSKASNAVAFIDQLTELNPSTLIYNGQSHSDREDSSTVLWFAARACYISVQELEQIQKRVDGGSAQDDADPNHFTSRLSRARIALHRLYSDSLADSILGGSVEPYSPEFFANLSDTQFWAHLGLKFAYASAAENEHSASAHKWVAISADKVGQVTDRKTRIVNAKIFFKHTTRATELNPNDPVLYHMLGRFEFEIASLAWWQRAAAAALFGTLPECKMTDAQGNLERAKELRPLWPLNLLYLARAYRATGDNDMCLSILDELVSMVPNTTEDEISIGDAVSLRQSML